MAVQLKTLLVFGKTWSHLFSRKKRQFFAEIENRRK
jgi:hypothetical protein